MQIVWFKRDLRINDHVCLSQASSTGPVIPLYIIEPKLWMSPDLSYRHYEFLKECLAELNDHLTQLGQPLILKFGEAEDVLKQIIENHPIKAVWAHQETWNGWTYQRDITIRRFLKQKKIPFHEPPHNGVIRCLDNRNGWAARWYQSMKKPTLPPPKSLTPINITSDPQPRPSQLGLDNDGCKLRQHGGRSKAIELMESFLKIRGENYTKEMSSPVTAFESCSRLSPHFAFGTLSIREAFQRAQAHQKIIKELPIESRKKWSSALRSFTGRLRWHCHFIQKLEDEPRIEYYNMHSAYDALRTNEFNEHFFQAWKAGQTGYPMIDACMRALTQTGWINFRMRAMLMSFASYHLWLNWRQPALHLARLFTDYEPGIHYSQVQMQSGTTGINSIRIYNPIKQGIDQDPKGEFIRQWVPELNDVPDKYIHTPWECPDLMNGYPIPIVDEKAARKHAADQLYGLRKNRSHRFEARHIVQKHGSRKKTRTFKKSTTHHQNELPL